MLHCNRSRKFFVKLQGNLSHSPGRIRRPRQLLPALLFAPLPPRQAEICCFLRQKMLARSLPPRGKFYKKCQICKKAVDIFRPGCYSHSITNAMTQSSKQGDALREVPGGARHSAIQLPNWLYSGCVEPQ